MKLLVTRRMTAAAERALNARFETTLRDSVEPLTETEAAQALTAYDAIMPTLGDAFTRGAFSNKDLRCRIIANFGAGFNHIDIEAAAQAGVPVTNTPDAVTDATADIAMTLLLMSARRAGEGERMLRAGQWTGWNPTQLLGSHVTGKTLGIIGMGRIGKAVARRAHYGFSMPVVFYNRSPVSPFDLPARQLATMDEVLATADFTVLAVPGGAGTRNLIGAAQLALMPARAHLINVSRGDVVDEAALIEALITRRIAGAGLDVYAREPEVPQALRALENATLLPHLGTAAEEVRTAMAMRAMDNLLALQRGDRPKDQVN